MEQVENLDEQLPPIRPYEQAKFYTAMRHRLEAMSLQSSALAVFIGLHTLCDSDTGRFTRDDAALREILRMPRSTIFNGFYLLSKTSLIQDIGQGEYVITDYEADRTAQEASYFRLSPLFLRSLGNMVSHHQPRVILFGLEILDGSRTIAPEIRRKVRTLIRERRLGSCPSRVEKALSLLNSCVRWTTMPSASGTEDVVQFWLIKEDTRTVEQDEWRALHGAVTRETKRGYAFAKGDDPLSWALLSRTTRLILEYGIELSLPTTDIIRLGGYYGVLLARNHIRKKLAYLRKIRKNGDLLKCLQELRRTA